jgi:hypothetical protein
MSIINGKKPLSTKPKPSLQLGEEAFGLANTLSLTEEIKNELTSKGYEWRFVNAKQMYANQGYHKNGWVVYKRDKKSNDGILFGNDPEGIIRRGDSILAVKPKQQAELHREFLSQKAARAAGSDRERANDLRQMVKERSNGALSVTEDSDE